MTIALIEIMRAGFLATYGTIILMASIMSLMMFMIWIFVVRSRVITGLLLSMTPFMLATLSAIVDLSIALPIFAIVLGIALALAIVSMIVQGSQGR